VEPPHHALPGQFSMVFIPKTLATEQDIGRSTSWPRGPYHQPMPARCVAAADPATHEIIIRDQLRMVARIASADEIEQALQASGPY